MPVGAGMQTKKAANPLTHIEEVKAKVADHSFRKEVEGHTFKRGAVAKVLKMRIQNPVLVIFAIQTLIKDTNVIYSRLYKNC